VLLVLFSAVIFAQERKDSSPVYPGSSEHTVVLYPTSFFVSEPARDFPQFLDKEIFKDRIIPKNGIETSNDISQKRQRKLDHLNSAGKSPTSIDPLLGTGYEPVHITETRAPIVSFEDNSSGASPPDPSMAVGPNHIVTMENGTWSVYNKTGVRAAGFPKILTNPLQSPGNTQVTGDPVVVYDREADRWMISQFQRPTQNSAAFLIGISTTPDPTGSYNVYTFSPGHGNDYPHFAIWGDSYVTAGNFGLANNTVYVFNRTKMLAGDATAEMIGFAPPGLAGSGFTAPMPVHSEASGAATGPIKIVYYQDDAFPGVATDHLGLWDVTVNWNTVTGSISSKNQIPAAPFDSAIAGGFANIAQPGTGQRIDAIVGAIMNMAHWYKFGTHESIVLNWVVETVDGTQISGIRWMELRSTDGGASWSTFQEGTFEDPTGNESVFMGCIAMDKQGNIGLGYTKSGTSTFPSLYYTGRMNGDTAGVMTVTEDLAIAGTGSVTFIDRYGDYGQAVVDPTDDLTFWVTSEYSGNARNIRVYSFKLGNDFNNDVGVTAILQPNTGAGLSATETVQVTIENFGLVSQSNIPVNFSIDGLLIGTETFAGPLAAGASANFTFTLNTADLSVAGQTYAIQACTALAADEDVNNDCFAKNVQHLLGDDVGVVAISAPNSGTGLTGTETVTITVENFGGNSQSNIPVQFTIDGGGLVNEIMPGPIAPGTTGTYTFTATADLSATASYNVCSRTNLVGDQLLSNDEFCKIVANLSCIPVATDGCNIDGIKQFILGTINVDDGGDGCNSTGTNQGYVDRTSLSTDLDRVAGLNVHTLQARTNWDGPPAGSEQMSVWIDFNDNGTFEVSERLITASAFANGANALSDFTLSIPTTANLGSHIMRCRAIDTSGAPGDVTDPCANFQYGETHDYTVNIIDSVLLSVDDNQFNNTSLDIVYLENNKFNVELNTPQSLGNDLRVDVHNLLGQKLLSMPITYVSGKYQYKLNLSGQATGIYVVTVGNNKFKETKKIVVK
jgi:hypothetical protein